MSQPAEVDKLRAATALSNVADMDQIPLFIGSYSTRPSGGSIDSTLGHRFCQHHGLETGDSVIQYLDQETGALVILPEDATGRCPSMEGRDD